MRRIGFPASDQLAGEFRLNPAELAGEFWERGGVNFMEDGREDGRGNEEEKSGFRFKFSRDFGE